jgi:hypothetical protein
MPTPTYTPLATVTLSSAATSVTFSSIPATYRDLILVIAGETSAGDRDVALRFNSDTGSNYSRVLMFGDGSSTGSNSATVSNFPIAYNSTSGRFQSETSIMDYSATDKHKTGLSRSNQSNGLVSAWAARWANTSAVNSLQVLLSGTGNFNTGTVFSLFGILA